MLLIGVRARAVKEGDRDDGGQVGPALFTMAPATAAKCTHCLHVCAYA